MGSGAMLQAPIRTPRGNHVIGIVLFIAAVWAVVRAIAPAEWPAGAVTAIAVWTGIWCGLFLGGTVAVGRWSLEQGH
jgi:MFS-type transporter involved in bile tolerance (Atg22 family)